MLNIPKNGLLYVFGYSSVNILLPLLPLAVLPFPPHLCVNDDVMMPQTRFLSFTPFCGIVCASTRLF